MKTKRSLRARIIALAIGLGLLGSVASFAYIQCYPCTQCPGKCCFIYTPSGILIGSICNSCCSGTV
jgi:hypothetical protein